MINLLKDNLSFGDAFIFLITVNWSIFLEINQKQNYLDKTHYSWNI